MPAQRSPRLLFRIDRQGSYLLERGRQISVPGCLELSNIDSEERCVDVAGSRSIICFGPC